MSQTSNSQKNKAKVGGIKPKNKTARNADTSTSGLNKKPNANSRFHGPNTATINSPGVTSPNNNRLQVPQTALQRRRNDINKVNNIRQQLEQKRN